MNHPIQKRPAAAASVLEEKFQCRLRREKLKLLIFHILFFILSAGVLLFAI